MLGAPRDFLCSLLNHLQIFNKYRSVNIFKKNPTRDDELAAALPTAAAATAVHGPSLPAGPPLHHHSALHAGPEVFNGHRVDDDGRHALAVPLL